jgi:hypothetical protein
MALSEPGAIGITGGVRGLKADTRNTLKVYEALKKNAPDIPDDLLWKETGWSQIPGGHRVREIPMGEAKLNERELYMVAGGKAKRTMADVYDAPELYANYPDLAGMIVNNKVPPGSAASFYAGNPALDMAPEIGIGIARHPSGNGLVGKNGFPNNWEGMADMLEIKRTFDHELSHGVANLEGHPRGANTNMYLPDKATHSALKDMNDVLATARWVQRMAEEGMPAEAIVQSLNRGGGATLRPLGQKQIQAAVEYARMPKDELLVKLKENSDILSGTDAFNKYQRNQGEATARLDENRTMMTKDQSPLSHPYEFKEGTKIGDKVPHFDVAPDKQIIRYRGDPIPVYPNEK